MIRAAKRRKRVDGERGGAKGNDSLRALRGDISANNFANEMSTSLIHFSVCCATNLRLINELRRTGHSPFAGNYAEIWQNKRII